MGTGQVAGGIAPAERNLFRSKHSHSSSGINSALRCLSQRPYCKIQSFVSYGFLLSLPQCTPAQEMFKLKHHTFIYKKLMFNYRLFYLATTFFLISFSLVAQKEDYQWALGAADCPTCYYRFFYDFNTDPPSIVLRSDSMNTTYFTASIASPTGEVLAYSNGLRIQNSDGLNPNFSSTLFTAYPIPKTGFFLPKPEDSNIIYLIHVDYAQNPMPGNFYLGRDLRLTTVNLSLNNGQGKVVSKNEILFSGRFTTPSAVRHANGRDSIS